MKPRLIAPACSCAAYRFPHRAAGGKCECLPAVGVDENRLTRPPALVLPPLCEGCGLPASTHEEDDGYGLTEAWGHVTDHVDLHDVTDCCGAGLVANTAREAARCGWAA